MAVREREGRRPKSPLFSVRFEPHEVQYHVRDHVLHLITKRCEWPTVDEGFEKERDLSTTYSLGFASCTIVPEDLTKAYTARHVLVGKKESVLSTSVTVDVSYVTVWAIAITASNFRAMPLDKMKAWTFREWKANLLKYGGRLAIKYKTSAPEEVTLFKSAGSLDPSTELCMIDFKENVVGAVNVVSAFRPDLLEARLPVELFQLGFPSNYCKNPRREEWILPIVQKGLGALKTRFEEGWSVISNTARPPLQGQHVLQWAPNVNIEQIESKFSCDTDVLKAGQAICDLRLPCTSHHGDSGGAVYLVVRNHLFRGKKKKKEFHLLGVIVGGLPGVHVSVAWPVNDNTVAQLAAAGWQEFLAEKPADRETNPQRLLALAGRSSTSYAI